MEILTALFATYRVVLLTESKKEKTRGRIRDTPLVHRRVVPEFLTTGTKPFDPNSTGMKGT